MAIMTIWRRTFIVLFALLSVTLGVAAAAQAQISVGDLTFNNIYLCSDYEAQLTIVNDGTLPVTMNNVKLQYPDGLSYVPDSGTLSCAVPAPPPPGPGDQGSGSANPGLVWDFATVTDFCGGPVTLAPGASLDMAVQFHVPENMPEGSYTFPGGLTVDHSLQGSGGPFTAETTFNVVPDLTPAEVVYANGVSGAPDVNCVSEVTFDLGLADEGCIDAEDVTVSMEVTFGDATLGAMTLKKTQDGGGLVALNGTVPISGLEEGPAVVEFTVEAPDCCGNPTTYQHTVDVALCPRPVLEVEKQTFDADADIAPGKPIPYGSAVIWYYTVTNTGNTTLSDITVTDDNGTPDDPTDDLSVNCPKTELLPDESMVCTAQGTAYGENYENNAVAVGTATTEAGPIISPDSLICRTDTGEVEYAVIPADSEVTGRGINFTGTDMASFNPGSIEFQVVVPPDAGSLEIGIFDGDAEGMWDTPVSGIPEDLDFILYADPAGDGSGTTELGSWTSPDMVDNGWYDIIRPLDATALSGDGLYRYRFVVEDNTQAYRSRNDFSIRAKGGLSTASDTILPVQTSIGLSSAHIIYPDWPPGVGPPSIPYNELVEIVKNTTYDGTYEFSFYVPAPTDTIEIWDGDFDFGDSANINPDTDDPNTPNNFIPAWFPDTSDPPSPEGVAIGYNGATGDPPDDNVTNPLLSAIFSRSPNVFYTIIAPDGREFVNDNLSGNGEWERFVVSTAPFDETLMDIHTDEMLPAGIYQINIEGLDMGNLNFMKSNFPFVANCENGTSPTTTPKTASAEDPSHYHTFPALPAIDVEKHTFEADADIAPGRPILYGTTVIWYYTVTNTGNTTLSDIVVTDDNGTPDDPSDDFTADCPKTELLPEESMICTAQGTADQENYGNNAVAVGTATTEAGPIIDPESLVCRDPDTGQMEYGYISGDSTVADGNRLCFFSADNNTFNPGKIEFQVAVPASAGNLEIGIFDGDTEGVWDSTPSSAISINYILYADPAGNGSTLTELYRSDGSDMVDNDWFDIIRTLDAAALSGDGLYRYRFVVEDNGNPDLGLYGTCFKIRAKGGLSATSGAILPIIAPVFSMNDVYIYYPNWPNLDPTTWSGTFEMSFYVPAPTNAIEIWDGDFDFGDSENINPDTDDPDTPNLIPAWFPETSNLPNPEGVAVGIPGSTGRPADDNSLLMARRSPNVFYTIIAPDGREFVNDNPSGNSEWERFVVSTAPFDETQMDIHTDEILPTGVYKIKVEGLDMRNLNFIKSNFSFIANCESGTVPTPKPQTVSDLDPSHYFPAEPAVEVEKSTNGEDADDPAGPVILVDGVVTWEYVVTNTGNTAMAGVTLTDDRGVTITCPDDGLPIPLLLPGDTVTCTATGTATEGQYENNVTAVGKPVFPTDPPSGFDPDDPTTYPTDPGAYDDIKNEDGTSVEPVTDEDPSHYFGGNPKIMLVKSVTSVVDTTGDGLIGVGDTITYKFEVTNTGNLYLAPVTISDAKLGIADAPCVDSLAVGATATCSTTGSYVLIQADVDAGGVENTAVTTGQPADPDTGEPLVDPITGQPLPPVTDISDTGTPPDGTTPIPNPEGVETPNPLGENPNNPGDPTEDPTTVLLTPNPKIMLVKSVTSVVDTTGDGLIGVGDTIRYKFVVTNTGSLYLAPVTISDAKLGIANAPCVDSLAVGATATCSTTGSYVITQADVNAGGVENTAVTKGQPADPKTNKPLVDPITGQPLPPVTDISDTGTPPDGTTPIPNPEGVETPNPLGENPNNPGDPTEDPTTVLLKPVPKITPSTPPSTPKVTPATPAAPECNLTVAIVDVNAKQLPDAILVEADPRFNTARAMYAVSEIQEVSEKLEAFGVSGGGPLLKTMPRYLSTYAGHNLGSLTFQSGMGLGMELSPNMISKMAADAGLNETPAMNPLLMPFEEGWPVQPDHDSLLWSKEDVETDLVPEALGQTLAAQSALLPELAASDNAEERFAASVMALQMRESAAFAADVLFKGDDGAYMPHRMRFGDDGITVVDASSRLADQAAMLRGLVKMSRAFKAAGIPRSPIVSDLTAKLWDAMETMHWNDSLGIYETSYDPETDKRSGRVEVYPVQLAALALSELAGAPGMAPGNTAADRLERVLGFVRDKLVAEDGGVYAAYDTASGKIETEEGYALDDMAGALRILLLSDATVDADAANTVFAAMEKDLWDHDKGMYRDHTKWDYDAEYTPVSVATTMAALTAMADKIDTMGEDASAILGKLSRFHDRVLYRSGLQREGNRLSPFMQADRLIVGDAQDVTYSREPVSIPSRLLADPVPETGLGEKDAPVLVKKIRMDLIPDDAEALLQLQDSDAFRLDREAPRTPLYLPPARLPKRSWRMSVDPETVQTATGLLYDAANVMKAQSVTTDNAFMTDPSILGPTADRIADLVGDYEPVSAEAFVKEQWPALAERFNWTGGEFSPDGPVTAEEVGIFAETAGRVSAALPANHAEKETLKQASAAAARFIMDQMNAASGEVTGLYPATASSDARDAVEDGIGNQTAPILGLLRAYEQTGDAKFLDGALTVYRAISEKRWDHALGIFLSREDRMHLSDTDTLRYQYTDLDIAATLYALSELLRYTDGDLKRRIAENAVQFAVHLLPEPAGVSDGEVTGVDVLLGGRNKVYPGDTLGITIVVKNTDEEGNPLGALADLSVTNYLPGGFAYVPRSGRLNRVESITPEISGTELRFNVDKTDDDGNITIEFNAKMSRNVQAAELKNKIVANGRTKEGGEGLCKPAFGEDVFNVGAKGSIKGKVFTDIDGNGAMGPGEKGLDGIRVLLDGNRDAFTDHTGAWNFDDLIPGEYEIRVDIATVPAGMRTTNDLLLIFPLKEGKTFIHHFGVESFTQLSE